MLSCHGRGYVGREGIRREVGVKFAVMGVPLTGFLALAKVAIFSGASEVLTFLAAGASEGAFKGLLAVSCFSVGGIALVLFVVLFTLLLSSFLDSETGMIIFGILTGFAAIAWLGAVVFNLFIGSGVGGHEVPDFVACERRDRVRSVGVGWFLRGVGEGLCMNR